jgi:hypothetical protein
METVMDVSGDGVVARDVSIDAFVPSLSFPHFFITHPTVTTRHTTTHRGERRHHTHIVIAVCPHSPHQMDDLHSLSSSLTQAIDDAVSSAVKRPVTNDDSDGNDDQTSSDEDEVSPTHTHTAITLCRSYTHLVVVLSLTLCVCVDHRGGG